MRRQQCQVSAAAAEFIDDDVFRSPLFAAVTLAFLDRPS
jgi:hypothetical protein